MWNVATRTCLYQIQAHDTMCKGIGVTHTSTPYMVTCSSDHSAKLWPFDVTLEERGRTGVVTAPARTFTFSEALTSLSCRRGAGEFCTGSVGGLQLWSLERGEAVRTWETATDGILSVQFSPTETQLIAATGGDLSVSFYDIRGTEECARLTGVRRFNQVAWNPMQPYYFVACSDDWNVYSYDFRSMRKELLTYGGHLGPVLSVDYSPTGREFCTGSYDKTVRIFKSTSPFSRDCYHTQRMQKVYSVLFSGDAHYLFSASDEGNVRVWKAFASKTTKIVDRREEQRLNYAEALKKKFKHMPEIRRIRTHQHLPKELMFVKNTRRVMKESEKRKEANRAKHQKREPRSTTHITPLEVENAPMLSDDE